jgi:hypothetical protein
MTNERFNAVLDTVQIRRLRRTPFPTDQMRKFRGYPANVLTGENEAVCPSTKVYGKQEFTYRQTLSSQDDM